MSSPIHKYLFSPPPSPPLRPTEDITKAHGLTSLKSLVLPIDLINRTSLDGTAGDIKLQPRSPRTPQQRHFTFDRVPGSPSLYSRPTVVVEDVEATPRTPRVIDFDEHEPTATPKASDRVYIPTNVPSTSIPLPSTLPRPVLRLLLLATLVVTSIMMLVFVPSARLPSLSMASTSRRLALATDARAYSDVVNGVSSWDEAKERDYAPPQIRVPSMMKRSAMAMEASGPEEDRVSIAPPKATRPHSAARPLPDTHELLAVQSYLLQSAYNTLPTELDPAQPLNADAVLSFGVQKLGKVGSAAEKAWLEEIEQERHDDIVIWYGGNGDDVPPHAVLDVLAALHGPKRKPHLIPVKHRRDLPILHAVLERQSLDIRHHPLVMIGNTPISGDLEGLEELHSSGKLRAMLASIGWLKTEQKKAVRPIKNAQLKKRVLTEIEHALKQA